MFANLVSCSLVRIIGKKVKCLEGECVGKYGHTRKVREIGKSGSCQYLQTLAANKEQWFHLCVSNSIDGADEDEHEVHNIEEADVINVEIGNTETPVKVGNHVNILYHLLAILNAQKAHCRS